MESIKEILERILKEENLTLGQTIVLEKILKEIEENNTSKTKIYRTLRKAGLKIPAQEIIETE